MDKDTVIAKLREHQGELKSAGPSRIKPFCLPNGVSLHCRV